MHVNCYIIFHMLVHGKRWIVTLLLSYFVFCAFVILYRDVTDMPLNQHATPITAVILKKKVKATIGLFWDWFTVIVFSCKWIGLLVCADDSCDPQQNLKSWMIVYLIPACAFHIPLKNMRTCRPTTMCSNWTETVCVLAVNLSILKNNAIKLYRLKFEWISNVYR